MRLPLLFTALPYVLSLIAAALVLPVADARAEARHVETHLYFGLSDPNGARVSAAEWDAFVAEVITPRFPDGLTVLTAYGQYTPSGGTKVISEDTRLLIVVHEPSDADAKRFEEIKRLYRQRFGIGGTFHTEAPVQVISGIGGETGDR